MRPRREATTRTRNSNNGSRVSALSAVNRSKKHGGKPTDCDDAHVLAGQHRVDCT